MSIDTSVDLILKEFPSAGNYTIAEELITPGRPENVRPVPENYRDPVFLKVMSSLGLPPNTMWTHQTEALDVIDNGMSAVLSTQTASGKTLVFQLASLKKIIRDPSARVQVFYPTKALNNDQRLSWRKVFEAAGLPQEQLGLIDGDIDMNARLDILQKARVLIMTPDTVHAWMMSNLKETAIQNFIANIQLRVLDEAHLYDGSFGTTFSYLLRRQKFAQAYLNPDYNHEKHGQIIAASATMDNPDAFLKNLTGNDFYSIGPEWDGSPRYEQKFTMMGVPDFKTKDAAERFLTALGHNKNIPGTTICFVDCQ
jgi:DEAD/DEAH box helicase domain-containing protein